MDLNETDVKLLDALSADGRKSLRSIANELKVSTVTVMNRVKKLQEQGVLTGFTTKIDPIKLGYGLTAVISIRTKGKKILDVQEKVAVHPNVCGIYDVTGEFDSVIVARFKDVRHLNKFVKNVLSMDGIERTQTSVALNVIKEDFGVKV